MHAWRKLLEISWILHGVSIGNFIDTARGFLSTCMGVSLGNFMDPAWGFL